MAEIPLFTDNALFIKFLVIAALGGFVSHLINNGNILKTPKRDKNKTGIHLSFIADILIGIVAAFASLMYFDPDGETKILGIAAIAGYGGSSILQAFSNKLLAGVNQNKATLLDRVKDIEEKIEIKQKEKELQDLKKKLFAGAEE